jgi:hypothetical protein
MAELQRRPSSLGLAATHGLMSRRRESFAPSDFTSQLSGAFAVDEQFFSFTPRVPNKLLEHRRAFAR